jgi:hypothetical protein
MRATILNCTLKPSPATSNTEALARVVSHALEEHGVDVELVRVADHDVKPGVSSDEGDGDEWPQLPEKVLGSEILVVDIGWTVPGQAWTYWNKGPGPGPGYLETDEGREWSETTGKTAAQNLVAVAQALGAQRMPVPVE